MKTVKIKTNKIHRGDCLNLLSNKANFPDNCIRFNRNLATICR